MKSFRKTIGSILDNYFILIAGIVIYGYYLLTSVDLIETAHQKRGFLDYLFQFDSVILLWILAAVIIQLQRFRKQRREEDEYRRKVQVEFERQRIHLQLLDEITTLLQDHVNNPLSMISVSSRNIRKQFAGDDEIISYIDRIENSLHRIHSTIKDIKAYQEQNARLLKEKTEQRKPIAAG